MQSKYSGHSRISCFWASLGLLFSTAAVVAVAVSELHTSGRKEALTECWTTFQGISAGSALSVLWAMAGLSTILAVMTFLFAVRKNQGGEGKRGIDLFKWNLSFLVAQILLSGTFVVYTWKQEALADRRLRDGDQLKSISMALHTYAADYGVFPTRLSDLVRSQDVAASLIFRCPGEPVYAAPDSASEIDNGKCDYTYYQWQGSLYDIDLSEKRILAHTRDPDKLGGWINFVFLNTHIEGVKGTSVEDIAREKGWHFPTNPK